METFITFWQQLGAATLYLLSEWTIRISVLLYLPQRHSPAASRTWLLLIFLLPWPGLLLYWLFGRINLPRHRRARQAEACLASREMQALIPATASMEPALPAWLSHIPALTERLGDFSANAGNRLQLITDYQQGIDQLLSDIEAAQESVHLLYYIYANDSVGAAVSAALQRARNRGVVCRVLVDAVGSASFLQRQAPRLRQVGIRVVAMLPVGLFRRNTARFDLRNHRKLAIIDGRIGYLGSQNIVAASFVPERPNIELVARVEGPLCAAMQAVFLADLYLETGRVNTDERLFPPLPLAGRCHAQLLPSGPGYPRDNVKELMVALIHAAQREVVIATAYFVPDEAILQALHTAVLRQVRVELIVSRQSNQRLTQLAQQSFYEELCRAGVSILLFDGGHLHAKHLRIDRHIALLGSPNVDIRSFELNAEVAVVVYDADSVALMADIEAGYRAHSQALELSRWLVRSLSLRLGQNLARLLDSLL